MKNIFDNLFFVVRCIGSTALNFVRYLFLGFYKVCTNKITMMVFVIGLGLALINVSTGFKEEIKKQEQEMMIEVERPNIDYYYDSNNNNEYEDNMAIMDMIDCYRQNSNLDDVPANVLEVVNSLEKMYDGNGSYFSFLYQDLFSGFTVAYNANSAIFTASTIKAPAMIYI